MSEQNGTQFSAKQRKKRKTSSANQENGKQVPAVQHSTDHNREAWNAQGQPWRTEPEIDTERQTYLSERRIISPNVEKGVYPFKDIELSRADVEWLLATHEDGRGPVVLQDERQQDRQGLDLRGALLQEQDLRGLPLTRLCAGISYREDDQSHIVKERIRAARINLMAAKLDNADLMEAELCGALLYRATLERTNLCKAHLEGADLGNASLKETQLSQAFLQNADFSKSFLENVHLEYADLERAQFNNATIEGGFMIATHLQKADLRKAHIRKVDLKYAHMEEADLRQARIEKTSFHGAHFEEANLEGADLQGCHLVEAHLEEAELHQAHLEKANLCKAHLEGAYLVEAYMEEANLTEAHLERAILVQTNLQRAILIKARLEGARLAGAILKEALLNETHLEEADLEYAHLEGADLLGAHLEGARCCRTFFDSGTRLNGVTLCDEKHGATSLADVSWGNVNLSVVKWSQVKMVGDEQVAREKKRAGLVKDKDTVLEEYEVAVRTNRQLAVALQAQSLNEDAARFAYRAQINQRHLLLIQVVQCLEQLPKINWMVFELPIPSGFLTVVLKPGLALSIIAPFLILFLHISTSILAAPPLPLVMSIPLFAEIIVSLLTIPLLAIGLLIYKPFSRILLIALLLAFLYSGLLLSVFLLVVLLLEHPDFILLFVYIALFFAFFMLFGISQAQKLVKIRERIRRMYTLILPYFTVQLMFGRFVFSLLLDILAGYGYRPGRTALWYLIVVFGFATAYYAYGHLSLYPPDAFVYSLTSFHGRGFFPGFGNEASLHNPLVVLAALEAVIGLLIEISFIATFTQRFFGK